MASDGCAAQDRFGRGGHLRILTATAASALAGCQGPLSILDPAGPSASAIATVWWWMFGAAVAVLAAIVVVWLVAMRPRPQREAAASRRIASRWIVWGGIVLPGASIAALLVFGSPSGFHQLPLPGSGPRPMRIDAIGHQWWWEIHYPDGGVRLRDELRIPAGRPVDVHTQSRDVIHSFWVPRLGGKLDAVPGRTLVVRLQADQVGTLRGQCAEFCGQGHAHMAMVVHVMAPADFDAWLRARTAPPTPDAGAAP